MSRQTLKKNRIPARAGALYVHVPLCRRKCRYCDFFSCDSGSTPPASVVDALLWELQIHENVLKSPLDSIFVGGGTPTILEADNLRRLLEGVACLAGPRTEFTVEANPDSLTEEVAAVLASAGANRVSVGVQSLADVELAALGRLHNAAQVETAVNLLRANGLANFSLDLIYGIPGQSLDSWRRTLGAAIDLAPRHVSCYALSFEDGTALHDDLHAGRVEEMPDDMQQSCYRSAVEMLAAAGLERYEISNFCVDGARCVHNMTYWRNMPYLGVGPSAASYIAGVRRTNWRDIHSWLGAVQNRHACPCDSETLDWPMNMAETLMLSLRLCDGVERRSMIERFGADPVETFPQSIGKYAGMGLLIVDDRLRLAPDAFFLSNSVLADIIHEAASFKSPVQEHCD